VGDCWKSSLAGSGCGIIHLLTVTKGSNVGLFFTWVLTLVLIVLLPLSAAEQNEINPKNEGKLFER
jgi:hypothetical protein